MLLGYLLYNNEVNLTERAWIYDLGTSISWDIKYFKTTEVYWHMNIFVSHAPVAKKQDQHEVILQLDKIAAQN